MPTDIDMLLATVLDRGSARTWEIPVPTVHKSGHYAEEFARAVEFDRALREIARQATGTARLAGDVFVHSSLKPLDQVKFSDVPEKLQVNLFGNECEGLCGV